MSRTTFDGDGNIVHITAEVAQKFLADPEGVGLSLAESIDDDAAEMLSKHQGDLSLDGLTELSDAAVESLSRHRGGLFLGSLKKLTSQSLAATLAQNPEELFLEIEILSPEAAAELAKQERSSEEYAPYLNLACLTDLTHETALALAGHSGHLILGIKSLSADLARALSSFRGESLCLNDVSHLSDDVAEILSQSEAEELALEGLESISAKAAGFLLQHNSVVTELDLAAIAYGDEGGMAITHNEDGSVNVSIRLGGCDEGDEEAS